MPQEVDHLEHPVEVLVGQKQVVQDLHLESLEEDQVDLVEVLEDHLEVRQVVVVVLLHLEEVVEAHQVVLVVDHQEVPRVLDQVEVAEAFDLEELLDFLEVVRLVVLVEVQVAVHQVSKVVHQAFVVVDHQVPSQVVVHLAIDHQVVTTLHLVLSKVDH